MSNLKSQNLFASTASVIICIDSNELMLRTKPCTTPHLTVLPFAETQGLLKLLNWPTFCQYIFTSLGQIKCKCKFSESVVTSSRVIVFFALYGKIVPGKFNY